MPRSAFDSQGSAFYRQLIDLHKAQPIFAIGRSHGVPQQTNPFGSHQRLAMLQSGPVSATPANRRPAPCGHGNVSPDLAPAAAQPVAGDFSAGVEDGPQAQSKKDTESRAQGRTCGEPKPLPFFALAKNMVNLPRRLFRLWTIIRAILESGR